jgi:hypothetical protein
MILQFLQKPFLLLHIHKLQQAMDQEIERQQRADPEALARREQTGVTVDQLRMAKQKLADAHACVQNEAERDAIYMPRDRVASQTQSTLQQYVAQEKADWVAHQAAAAPSVVPFTTAVLRTGGNLIVDLFSHFGPADVGWVSCLIAEALYKLEGGPRPFNQGPAPINPIGNKARIILLSDWGTGVPRAQDVAKSARRFIDEADRQGRDVHVVHLGDVYYSGYKFEYDQNFLPYWPVNKDEADKFPSYNLNGNHDMYSGGFDYFDYLLADRRFRRQQQCSFFGLENDFWQLLALDTAYLDADLAEPQPKWVLDARNSAPHKKGILLSHHQPFSAFEDAGPEILKKLKPVTDQDLILGWWWGHEHRCAFYAPRPEVRYGRCIGYGGVPILAETQYNPPEVIYQYQDFVAGGDPLFARFGFAVMDFDNQKLHVQYLGENGIPHQQEDIVAVAGAAQSTGSA